MAGTPAVLLKTNTGGVIPASIGASEAASIPTGHHLGRNYPTPFNPSTVISFPDTEECTVRLVVRNVLGQVAATQSPIIMRASSAA